jgi:hypothetical protein
MVKFIDVDPNEIPNLRDGRRGRVSYPILKSFMETGKVLAKLDRTGIQQSLQSLNSSLGAYIRSHNLPLRVFNRQGEIYLARTDTDLFTEDGMAAPAINIDTMARVRDNVGVASDELLADDSIPDLDDEVEVRATIEAGQTTK